CQQYSYWLTF
nr:immunoglobulin light chain junction region [Macaca mulatta]MOX52410.1 immunoglobulin light chain junction region [Macaca mulatta]MOX52420.1 immunoglobulin light chain junction region [Macaca mulatta]MOX52730.1 immunoglobulin light chain junction region [Macaca mulatta]MOX52796.1 immunoglobulin light chain junction region [Macaca mulatta]